MPTIEHRLQQWQQELLDFSNRNRLLNFRSSTTRPSSIELIVPGAAPVYQTLLEGRSLTVVGNDPVEADEDDESPVLADSIDDEPEDLEPGFLSNSVSVRPGTALSGLPNERTNRVLLRLLIRARASEQEQGINTLFAAFGLLKWQEKTGSESWQYAPLVMLPLVIEERTRERSFRIGSAGEDPEFNQTVVERLRRDFGLDVAVDIDEESNLASVFQEVRDRVSRQPGWEVLEQVHLGHFQFYKLRMYEDLAEHASLAADHEIIAALGSDLTTIAPLPEGVPREEELDRAVLPQDSFTILDADASQLRAVQAVVRGAHLIIQGPPGTGKSQTIANIIAESIASGRTVLFVSEKAAAIDVVHRRLAERGLEEYCLMLHSHKANKREIIAALGARLESTSPPTASPQEQLTLQRLQEHRIDLDTYVEALHRQREPLDESVYWVHGQLASLQNVPLIFSATADISALSQEELDRSPQLVDDLSRYARILNEGTSHPWSGARVKSLTLTDRERLRDILRSLIPLVRSLQEVAGDLAQQLRLPPPTTVSDLRNLASVAACIPENGGLRPAWFEGRTATEAANLVGEAASHSAALRELEARLLADFESSFFEIDAVAALASYEQGFLARLFSSSYKSYRTKVRDATKGGQSRSVNEEAAALRDLRRYQQERTWFLDQSPQLSSLLGVDRPATELDAAAWEQIRRHISLAKEILDTLGPGSLPAGFVEQVCQPGAAAPSANQLRRLQQDLDLFTRQMTSLSEFFLDGAFPEKLRGNLEGLGKLLEQRAARFDDLDLWIESQLALNRVEQAGLQPVLQSLLDRGVPSALWGQALRRLLLMSWLDHVVQQEPVLQGFSRDQQDRRVSQFSSLDREYLRVSNLRARRAHAEKQTRVTAAFGGEPQVLLFETQKRKRHMPLRKLFERIPNLLPTLKPCLMMSPLSVAQYLPADLYQFDLIIFDEASQVRPHDAIGAIMRGKQLVVAGDSKQLPPTTFFDRVTDEGEVDEGQDLRALESILDAVNAKGMPAMRLLWHYRSRHEDLIAYSNHHFYDSRLITFPSPSAERSVSRGVRFEFVPDGRYEDERDRVLRTPIRVNRVEAKRVAQLVLDHARTRPDETLGVVTLGMNQRDVVEEEIKEALLLQHHLDDFFRLDKPEPFFVKALEQVQGDERDVILVSVGYGKNAAGVLSHNFGPINQQGGERRLNVLVTGARKQVVLVSSIRFTEYDPERTQNLGPRLLRNYLEFAERGADALLINAVTDDGEYESPFEEEVGEALKRAGFTVHRQVGSSRFRIDLAIVHPQYPDRYILGVECDGKTYHQSKAARDRDRLRHELLEQLGWSIHRIWSTEWIHHPDRELQRVIDRVHELMSENAEPRGDHPTGPGYSDREGQEDIVLVDGTPSESQEVPSPATTTGAWAPEVEDNSVAVPYRAAELTSSKEELWETPVRILAKTIVQCVEEEGPIHKELLLRRITDSWGYQRAGSRIARHVATATGIGVRSGRIREVGAFLWPAEDIEVVPRGPALDGTLREISHVPDDEIAQAISAILERAYSLSPDDLAVQSSRVFGFQRTGSEIRDRILSVARAMYKAGALDYKGDRVQLIRP
jgi:very-short-patch-repair endonuclease